MTTVANECMKMEKKRAVYFGFSLATGVGTPRRRLTSSFDWKCQPSYRLTGVRGVPASKFKGVVSVIFGSQVSLRVHYCKRYEV